MYQKIQNKIIELIPHDKCLHFIFGFILFVVSNYFLSDEISLGVTFLVALIKEIRDYLVYGKFDYKDIIFTIIPSIILITLS